MVAKDLQQPVKSFISRLGFVTWREFPRNTILVYLAGKMKTKYWAYFDFMLHE